MTIDQPYPRRWAMLPAILSASFMTLFDFNVVNVAAPSLQHDLHAGQAALQMVVGGYAFTYAAGMVIGGRLGDQVGHRRMFLIGITTFALASLLCGVAQSPGQLIAARLLQGLTGAMMVPQVLALITSVFPAPERPKAMSWFGVTLALGSVAGQILGGVLVQADLFGLGWRAIFLLNVPISVVAVLAAARLLPDHLSTDRRHRFDVLGAIGIATSLGLVLVPLILGREQGWPVWGFILMVLAVPAFGATLWWERRHAEPVLDLQLFRSRAFMAGLPANAAFMGYFGSYFLVLTLVWQEGLRLSALQAGLAFLPMGVVFALVSVLGRSAVARMGARAVTLGSLIVALGLIVMIVELHVLRADLTVAWLLPATAIIGLGSGLAFLALIGSVLANVEPTRAGAAAGVLTTTQQFASAAGVAILGSIFFANVGTSTSLAAYARSAERYSYLALVCVLASAVLATLIQRRQAVPQAQAEPASSGAK
ncbi:MFS transporter [Micromonospora musae]|uniref:MFS transporter n=1 Tax=Micromonospora musae TaxID=1894970 RepID=UPI00342392CF